MSMTIVFAIVCLCAAIPMLTWAVLVGPDPVRKRVTTNLQRGFVDDRVVIAQELAAERPKTKGWVAIVQRLSPGGSIIRIERLLSRAGHPPNWPIERILAMKLVAGGTVAVVATLYALAAPGTISKVLGVFATVLAYFVPELLLRSRGQERNQRIQLELADTLDQLTIAVEAGLGFDSALSRAGKNGKGPLAQELVRTLQEIQVGKSRRQAYEALAERTGVPDLRRFIRAIVQAEAYGISIAGVLRTQAAEMRLKRRQRAEEKAMQIPVKVLFPLMFCILPVLFLVLLGPAVMDIMKTFGGG